MTTQEFKAKKSEGFIETTIALAIKQPTENELLRDELRILDLNGYLLLDDDELNENSTLREIIRLVKENH